MTDRMHLIECLRALYGVSGEYENQRADIDTPVPGTCKWVLENAQSKRWLSAVRPSLLWITANPGCGESVLARFIADELVSSQPNAVVFPFFFHGGHEKRTKSHEALCALLHSIFTARPPLLYLARDQFAAKERASPLLLNRCGRSFAPFLSSHNPSHVRSLSSLTVWTSATGSRGMSSFGSWCRPSRSVLPPVFWLSQSSHHESAIA